MSLNSAILATVAILVVGMLLGLAALFMFVDVNSASANQRAAALGQGMAVLILIPLFIIWIKWAADHRK